MFYCNASACVCCRITAYFFLVKWQFWWWSVMERDAWETEVKGWLCSEDSFRQIGVYCKVKTESVCMQMWGGSEKNPYAVRGSFFFISIYKVSKRHKCGIWWVETHWTRPACHRALRPLCQHCLLLLCSGALFIHLKLRITIVERVCNLTSVGDGCLLLHTSKTFVL